MRRVQAVFDLTRSLREKRQSSFKQPLSELTIVHRDPEYLGSLAPFLQYLKDELNVLNVNLVPETPDNIVLSALPDNKKLGLRLKKKFNNDFRNAIKNLSHQQLLDYEQGASLTVMDEEMGPGDLLLYRNSKSEGE